MPFERFAVKRGPFDADTYGMVGVHIPARRRVVRARRRDDACAQGGHGGRSERGFAVIELIVVLLIVAVLLAIVVPNMRSTREAPAGPALAIGGGTIWRAAQMWRLENGGLLPPMSAMTGRASGLVDPAGRPMVRTWPELASGTPITIATHAPTAAPPATGPAQRMLYTTAANRRTGWLAGYDARGRLVFVRGIASGASPVVPRG